MRQFILRRLLRSIVVLWGISTIVFLVMRLSGDPVMLLLPQDATQEDIARVSHQLGLDRPLHVQYGIFLVNLLRLDFGQSIHFRQPAIQVALERVPATLELATAAFLWAITIAVPIGVIAAMKPYSILDNTLMLTALFGMSAPTFFVGIMLILLLSLGLGLFPTGGRGDLSHLVLPAITLGAYTMAAVARLTRSAMLEVIRTDYIRTARAKGLMERMVVYKHALKNAAIPVVTIMGIQLGMLLGGAVVTETVFSWPGIGRLAIQSIYSRDYNIVQCTVFMTACWFVAVNFAVDLIYGWLDPRIRYT
jgi:peptide/nickel transport system permease protein